MTVRQSVAIAAGGVCGAALRWLVISSFPPTGPLRWVVLGLNVAGSGLLGLLLAAELTRPGARTMLHDFGGIGFCGGLTTFSTFSLEVAELLRAGSVGAALAHVGLSVALSLVAVVAGASIPRRVSTRALPLEDQP